MTIPSTRCGHIPQQWTSQDFLVKWNSLERNRWNKRGNSIPKARIKDSCHQTSTEALAPLRWLIWWIWWIRPPSAGTIYVFKFLGDFLAIIGSRSMKMFDLQHYSKIEWPFAWFNESSWILWVWLLKAVLPLSCWRSSSPWQYGPVELINSRWIKDGYHTWYTSPR